MSKQAGASGDDAGSLNSSVDAGSDDGSVIVNPGSVDDGQC